MGNQTGNIPSFIKHLYHTLSINKQMTLPLTFHSEAEGWLNEYQLFNTDYKFNVSLSSC